MKTETQNLAALVRLALQNKTFIPVGYAEIINALSALQTASEIIPFLPQHIAGIVTDLHEALHTVAGLLYITSNNMIPVNGMHRKTLVSRASKLHKKLSAYLQEHSNTQVILPGVYNVKSLLKILSGINDNLKHSTVLAGLYALLQPVLEKVLTTKALSFHGCMWWSRFASIGSTPINHPGLLEDFLVKLNFNDTRFTNYLSVNLLTEIQSRLTIEAKSEFLMEQLVKYKSMALPTTGYVATENSVAQTMIAFLEMRLTFLATRPPGTTISAHNLSKIHTVLSVPQLALLIRLLAETKIFNENNQSALLKNVAACTSTSKAASISPESLRINYYTPNNATKNIIKEYLLQMIRLVNTY